MKLTKILLGLMICLLATTQTVTFDDPLKVYRADLLNSPPGTPLIGSMTGGAILVIRGTGFDAINCANTVLVGDIVCDTVGLSCTAESIMCQMPASSTVRQNLSITVTAFDKGSDSCSSQSCLFSYSKDATPLLTDLGTKSVIAGSESELIGFHKLSNPGSSNHEADIQGIFIGDHECVGLKTQRQVFQVASQNAVTCTVPSFLEAGLYNINQLSYWGYANKTEQFGSVAFFGNNTNRKFDLIVNPVITSVNTDKGSNRGTFLEIEGKSFSSNPSKVKVTAAGVDCAITELSKNLIKCLTAQTPTVGYDDGKISNGSGSRVKPYIAGAGAQLFRYNISDLTTKTVSGFRADLADVSPKSTLVKTETALVLKQNNVPVNQSVVIKGYFKPSTAGNLKFSARSDSLLTLYVSTVYGTASVDYTTPNLEITGDNKIVASSSPITVVSPDHHYYFELYHISSGASSFSVSAHIQSSLTVAGSGSDNIQTIKILAEPLVKEKVVYVQSGATGGTINFLLQRVDPTTKTLTYFKNITIPYDASEQDFLSMLNSFDIFAPYSPTVTRTMKNFAGSVITTGAAYSYTWEVEFGKWRPAKDREQAPIISTSKLTAATGVTPTVEINLTEGRNHSTPLGGTFRLAFDGVQARFFNETNQTLTDSTDIPVNVSASSLRRSLADAWNCESISVEKPSVANSELEAVFLIQWTGCPGAKATISTIGSSLSADNTISVVQTLAGSNDITYSPVSSYVMRVPASDPQITVTVDETLSVCSASCSLTLSESLITVTSYTYDDTTKKLTVVATDTGTTTVPNSEVVVYLSDQTYTGITGDYKNFDITFPQYLEKGTYKPKVKFGSRGLGKNGGSVADIVVNMALTGLSVSTIPDSGGLNQEINGKGFPVNKDKSGLTVTICSKSAQIISSVPDKITVVTPPCSDATTTATVTYGGTTTAPSSSITVDDTTLTRPTLTSVTPTSANPERLQSIAFTGTLFDSATPANCRAFLTSGSAGTRVVELKKISCSSATDAVFEYEGNAPSGEYNVVFFNDGVAQSTETVAFNVESTITELVPSTIAPINGAKIIIKGTNFIDSPAHGFYKVIFKPASETWSAADLHQPSNCTVINDVVLDQLLCELRLEDGFVPQINVDYNVYVVQSNKHLSKQDCTGTQCTIKFLQSESVTTNMYENIDVSPGITYTIEGTNFYESAHSSAIPELWIGNNKVMPGQYDETSFNFSWPFLSSGQYKTYVLKTRNQRPSKSWISTYALEVRGLSVTRGSINGARICIVGRGLHPTSDKLTTLTVSVDSNLITHTETSYSNNNDRLCLDILLKTPNPEANQTVNITYGYNGTLFNFSYLAEASKKMTIKSTDADDTETFQASGLTTLDFQVTTTLSLTGLTPNTIIYYHAGVNNAIFGKVRTLPVVWDALTKKAKISKANFDTLRGGSYCFHLLVPTIGFTSCGRFKVTPPIVADITKPSSVEASYIGGPLLTLTKDSLPLEGTLYIADIPVPMDSHSGSDQKFRIPGYTIIEGGSIFNHSEIELINPQDVIVHDPTLNGVLRDANLSSFYSETGSTCQIILQFDRPYLVGAFRFFVPYSAINPSGNYSGILFQGSNSLDSNSIFAGISSLDNSVHHGWNMVRLPEPKGPYKAVKILHETEQTSNCVFSELQLYGYQTGVTPVTSSNKNSLAANAILKITDEHTYQLDGMIQYKLSSTPRVSKIQPRYGSWKVDTTVEITGQNFGTAIGDVEVTIDQGKPCTVTAVIATKITCTAVLLNQERIGGDGEVTVKVAGTAAHNPGHTFRYVSLWSKVDTWVGDSTVVFDQSSQPVSISAGRTILVDVDNLNMGDITINGTLIIDELPTDLEFKAKTITVNYGNLIIGHPFVADTPQSKKITVKLTGTRQSMQPSKAIICNSCNLLVYGNVVQNPWNKLTQNSTATQIKVKTLSGANAQQVVIGPSLHFYEEISTRAINAITTASGVSTLTFSTALGNPPRITTKTTNIPYEVGAEVALKNRNVMITGQADSADPLFGARIIVNGPLADLNKRVVIRDVQMLGCGQVYEQMGSCIHFNNNGDAAGSSVERVIAGDTNSRMLTLTAVRNIIIDHNVGYNILGHGILMETGAEYGNKITNNLLMRVKQNPNIGGTDITPAGIWVSNPLNTVEGNVVAGSDADGIVYSLSATSQNSGYDRSICPEGIPLQSSTSNLIHSSKRYGLRVENYVPRKNPCLKADNTNTPITTVFKQYTISSVAAGVLAENIGQVDFTQFVIGDYNITSFWFNKTNRSKPISISKAKLIITNLDKTENINSHHYLYIPPVDQSVVFSDCKYSNSKDLTTYIDSSNTRAPIIFQSNFAEDDGIRNGQIYTLKWDTKKTNLMYIDSGIVTFLGVTTPRPNGAIIVPSYPHLELVGTCTVVSVDITMNWDRTLICNDGIRGRLVNISGVLPSTVKKDTAGTRLNVFQLSALTGTVTVGSSAISSLEDLGGYWAAPMLNGRIYAVWWDSATDFKNLTISMPAYYNKEADRAIILRFNYTEHKEVLEVTKVASGLLQAPLTASTVQLNSSTCEFGDYFHDVTNKFIFVCVRDKSRTDAFKIGTLNCQYFCDQINNGSSEESSVRKWSNASQWPGGVLPVAGARVTIPADQTILLDIDPPALTELIIEGYLLVAARDTFIQTDFMWVKGKFEAGTEQKPFNNNLQIMLTGTSTSTNYTFGDQSANKLILVTGNMTLFANHTAETYSYLADKVTADSTTEIKVDTTTFGSSLNWAANDELVISPSFKSLQYSFVTADTVTDSSFTPKVTNKPAYTHYGSSSPTVSVDTRSMVGHLSRKIKIISGPSTNNYGFRVLVTSVAGKNGTVRFNGVQFYGGGQFDSDRAALHFANTLNNTNLSRVEKCSFVRCNGICLSLTNSSNITVTNNVFAQGRKYLVYVEGQQDYAFTWNLMIGARVSRSLESQVTASSVPEQVACYYQPKLPNYTLSQVNNVNSNFCFGSQFKGFVTELHDCRFDPSTDSFYNNVAAVCQVGFFLNGQQNVTEACQWSSGISGYNNKVGLVANPFNTTMLKLHNVSMADCELGMSVRQGYGKNNSANITTIIEASEISTASRPNCSYCYGAQATNCAGARAIRHGPSTYEGKSVRNGDITGNMESINSPSAYDSKLLLFNVDFRNFKAENIGNLATCNGKLFEIHPDAKDSIGSINLAQTKCSNCDMPKSLVSFPTVGNDIACGGFPCYSLANFYIRDESQSLSLANFYVPINTTFAVPEGCSESTGINGYICLRKDIAVLQFESISRDQTNRTVWPINITYDKAKWTSTLVGPSEWAGFSRVSRFAAMLLTGKSYNISFKDSPPTDLRFSLQQKSNVTNTAEYVVVNITYPVNNSAVSVFVNDVKKVPMLASDQSTPIQTNPSDCGAHKYYRENGTISFLVTNSPTCEVRVKLLSAVIVSTTLNTEVVSFLTGGGLARFKTRVAEFLNVTESRINILKVLSGSTIIEYMITENVTTTTSNSNTENSTAEQVYETLKVLVDNVTVNGTKMNTSGLGDILSISANVSIVNFNGSSFIIPTPPTPPPPPTPTPEVEPQPDNTRLIVGVVVGVLGSIALAAGIYLLVKNCSKLKVTQNGQSVPNVSQDKIFPDPSDTRAMNHQSTGKVVVEDFNS